MSLIWYTSTNNSTWIEMKSPTTYSIDWEDLDNESYRSVMNGNLIRNVVKRRWAKIALEWKVLSASEVSTICTAVNKDTVYFKVKSPVWDSSGFIIFKGYVSKIKAELLEGMIGYSLSFNIVQSEGASFQS